MRQIDHIPGVLHRHGIVEAECLADSLDLVRGGVPACAHKDRVARCVTSESEGTGGHEKEDGDRRKNPANDER
jgi:hypothetical protein